LTSLHAQRAGFMEGRGMVPIVPQEKYEPSGGGSMQHQAIEGELQLLTINKRKGPVWVSRRTKITGVTGRIEINKEEKRGGLPGGEEGVRLTENFPKGNVVRGPWGAKGTTI